MSPNSRCWHDRARTWVGPTGFAARAVAVAFHLQAARRGSSGRSASRGCRPAASALEQLIDLACDTRAYDYFRSEDPVAAAGFVVSDVVAVLWASVWERHGFQEFAETAAPQLIGGVRYGWTRHCEGAVAAKETSLALVLARMLRVPDTWERFAEQYVRALDALCDRGPRRKVTPPVSSNGRRRW